MIAKVPRLIGKASGQNFNDHLEAFNEVIEGAEKISIAVAFFKLSGLKLVIDEIEKRLHDDTEIEIFIGRDFCITEPKALKKILTISNRYPSLTVYLARKQQEWSFHPKIYVGENATGARILIGSANLTKGALKSNEELSLSWEIEAKDALLTQIHNVFTRYRTGRTFKKLNKNILEQYCVEHEKNGPHDPSPLSHKNSSDIDSLCDLGLLKYYFEEYLQDTETLDKVNWRRKSRKKALKVQRKIARMSTKKRLTQTDKEAVKKLYYSLVSKTNSGPHWQSALIAFSKKSVRDQPSEIISLFEEAEKAANLSVEEGFRNVGAVANKINRVSTNILSELLCTFEPMKYAVFNSVTEGALKVLGVDLAKSANLKPVGWKKSLLHPDKYNQVCKILGRLRLWIEENGYGKSTGKDLSDLDAFLYWVVHNAKS